MAISSRVAMGVVAAILYIVAGAAASEIPGALAQSDPGYWTRERLQNARPMPLPESELPSTGAGMDQALDVGPQVKSPGHRPLHARADSAAVQICSPKATESQSAGMSGPAEVPDATGAAHAFYSSSRLIPITADTEYPYSTVGKLFFTIPGSGDFVCSGSVINHRIVLAAGHCAHSGNASQTGFYTNFMFVPSYRNGSAPNGTWTVTYLYVTASWYSGKGKVPNVSDFSMFEMQDDNNGMRIGDITGWLGYITRNLLPNHATLLGYPVNLDSGEQMHQVNAGSFQRGGANTVVYGSDMGHGASGGPWVQDFGEAANGEAPDGNYVIGVTSYLPSNSAFNVLGSSTPDQQFISLFTAACGHQAGNCS